LTATVGRQAAQQHHRPTAVETRAKSSLGVVASTHRKFFITLVRVTTDARKPGRKIWIALAVAGAVAVVVLSWRVPEPETHGNMPSPLVENISYIQISPQPLAPPPNYGTR
jgi:hypothetical protein